jgi:hypothetical protein
MNSVSRVVGVSGLGIAVIVWGHGLAVDTYCLQHALPLSCDNPLAPGPQMPDEWTKWPAPTTTMKSVVTANSTTDGGNHVIQPETGNLTLTGGSVQVSIDPGRSTLNASS